MITKYSLSNFKGFKDLNDLEIAPLTILVGKNSCGKSSILHSLLLLKQSNDNNNSEKPLTLEGKFLKYSNLKEMTFGQSSNAKAQISFTFESETENVNRKFSLGFQEKKIGDHYEIFFSKYFIEGFNEKINLLNINPKNLGNFLSRDKLGTIVNDMSNLKIEFNKLFPDSFLATLKYSGQIDTIKLPISFLSDEFLTTERDVRSFVEGIKFLSPLRATPDRAYLHYSEDPDELSHNGSNSAHILWAKKNTTVDFKNKKMVLIEAVNECIKSLGLTQEINPERIGNMLYQLKLNEKTSNKKVSISDVGFGYSQILPVILIGLLNNDDNLILVEQPEIHLHPSSAANLADLFLSFIKDKKRFLIETHSQEFINRLRLRVIENPELKSKINIVFIEQHDNKGAIAKQFKIDENGMFPEWPEGFLDESEKLAQAILKARINKSKRG